MPDQEITWKLIVDDQDAQRKFREVGDSIDELKDKGQDSVPVLGEVRDSLGDVGDEAEDTAQSVGSLGKIIGVGLVVAIGAATLAVIKLTKEFYQSDGSIKNLTSRLREHWLETFKVKKEWESFDKALRSMPLDEINASIDGLKQRLFELQVAQKTSAGGQVLSIFGYYAAETALLNKELAKLDVAKIDKLQMKFLKEHLGWDWDELEEKGIFSRSGDVYGEWIKNTQKLKKETEQLRFEFKNLEQASEFILAFLYGKHGISRKKEKGYTPFSGMTMKPVKGHDKPDILLSDEELKRLHDMEDYFVVMANTLRSEFSKAWQDIFGEANSLFEKLLMNIAEMLASKALTSLFGSFMNFLIPGAGTFLGWATGASGANGATGSVINLNMDNRTVAQFYVNGKNQANRLRMSD